MGDPLGLPGTVVISDDGNGGVVDAEQGHEEEALELEVDAEHAGGGFGKALENLVHTEVHHRADAVHHNGREAHGHDAGHGPLLQLEILLAELNFRIVFMVEVQGQQCAHALADHRCRSGAGHTHLGQPQPSKNQDGVQNNVDNGTSALGNHGVDRPAGGLEQPLAQNLHKDTNGHNAADPGVGNAAFHSFGDGGLHFIVRPDAENTEEHKRHRDNQHQYDAVASRPVGFLLVFLAQAFAQQGVHTHADAGGKADLHILHRECQGQCRHGAFRNLSHIDTVHHIIKRLYQHGDDHGQCHIDHQFSYRHHTHFVFLQGIGTHSILLNLIFSDPL